MAGSGRFKAAAEEFEALRSVLRACEQPARPIAYPVFVPVADVDLHHKLPEDIWPTLRWLRGVEPGYEETLPKDDAISVLRHFLNTGELAPWVAWIEG